MQIIGMCDRVQPCYRPTLLFKVHIWEVLTRPFTNLFDLSLVFFRDATLFSYNKTVELSPNSLSHLMHLLLFRKTSLTVLSFWFLPFHSFNLSKEFSLYSFYVLIVFVLYFNLCRGGYVLHLCPFVG